MAGAGAGAIRAGRAYAELLIKDTAFFQGLQRAEDRLKAFGQRTSEIGRSMMAASAVVVTPAALSTKVFAGFDDQMRTVQAVTQGTDAQLQQLTETAKRLGASTSFKAEEVAGGMIELGRAGFKTDEIDQSIEHVMNLARATQTDIPTATNIAAAALRAFNMDASEMGRVCDVLTTAANGSATTLPELGEALKYAASTGALTGETIESTSKNLMAMANMGVRGSMAGTSLRTIQTRMVQPKTVAKYERDYGIKLVDDGGNLRQINDILTDVQQKIKDTGSSNELKALNELFGVRGLVGGGAILNADFEGITEQMEQVAGAAGRVAEQMDAGIGGAFRRFSSAVEAVAIKIGEALSPELQRLTAYITENTAKVGEWITQNKETIVTVVKVAGEIGAAGAALVALGTTISGVSAAIGGFSSIAAAIATAFGFIASSPVAATLTAIGVAAAGITIAMQDAGDSAEELARKHQETAEADNAALARLEELADKTDLSNREMLEAAEIVADLNRRYTDLGLTVDPLTGKIEGLAGAQEKLNAAQLRTRIADQKALLREKREAYKEDFKDVNLNAENEYTLEELQAQKTRADNITTENHASSVSLSQQGTNLERAAINERTGKYQVASQKAGIFGDETAAEAKARLQRQLDAAYEAEREIQELEASIAELENMNGANPTATQTPAAQAAETKIEQAQQAVADATTQVAEDIAEKAKQEAAAIAETITPQENISSPTEVTEKSTRRSQTQENWRKQIEAAQSTVGILQTHTNILRDIRDALVLEKTEDTF